MKKLILIILLLIPFFLQGTIINVTNYGAMPDDGLIDTTNINNAIDAASANDTVYFPNGTYLITNTITLKSYIKIEGENQLSTVIKYTGTVSHTMIYMDERTNVEVCHLTLDGDNNTNTSRGIHVEDSCSNSFHDLKIMNLTNESSKGIYFTSDVVDSVISNNIFKDISVDLTWGCAIRIAWRSCRNKIVYNMITNMGRGGILCNDNSSNLIIQHNKIKGMYASGMGVEIWKNCNGCLIEHNVMDYWLSVDESNDNAVRRNTMSEKTGKWGYCGIELAKGINNVFTYNNVDWGSKIGISISNDLPKEYIFWGNNTIFSANTWGMQMMGEDHGAQYQYFYKNKFLNTPMNHPQALYENEGSGVRFNGNCHHITFENNTISHNERFGFNYSGSSLDAFSIVNNTINSNDSDSTQNRAFTNIEWTGNTVIGNGTDRQLSNHGFTNAKPTASFTCDTSVETNETINFSSTSSDPNGSIAHVLWDFDEGLPSTNLNPSYTYTTAGTYIVTLIVWDDMGRGARASTSIVVGGEEEEDSSQGARYRLTPVLMKRMGRDLDKGLIGHWSLKASDTNTDGRMNDLSDNTNYGTLNNSPTFVSNQKGEVESALLFNGSNQYVEILHSSIGNPSGSFTLSAWAKITSTGSGQDAIVAKQGAPSKYGYAFEYDWNGPVIKAMLGDGSNWNSITGYTWATNVWTFVVLSYDDVNNSIKFYEDNVLKGTISESSPVYNTKNLWIGGSHEYGNYWNGSISDVRFYNRCLTAWEIRKLYFTTKD